jgi:hypothetical protein
MPVEHIVWMQFKLEVTAQKILEHKRAVLGLKARTRTHSRGAGAQGGSLQDYGNGRRVF